jgi:hypothetical protein
MARTDFTKIGLSGYAVCGLMPAERIISYEIDYRDMSIAICCFCPGDDSTGED